MSHGNLREDKNCLNCGHIVDERFCPHCGQENTETRQPFHYLFTHFVEDFTHYDGQFWGTIKNLLFKPGRLTNIYLEGKRQQFVPPVKLYIFVSFVTFFLFALFPPYQIDSNFDKNKLDNIQEVQTILVPTLKKELETINAKKQYSKEDSARINEIAKNIAEITEEQNFINKFDLDKGLDKTFEVNGYTSRKSFDSAKAKNPSAWDFINVPFAHKLFDLKEKGVKKREILKNFLETSIHNLPKALFIYLPIFAFFLWLFHNKKRWWYFDHGIFTLHYFSYLLIGFMTCLLLFKASKALDIGFINTLIFWIIAFILTYNIVYFFIAHNKVYSTRKRASLLIGFVILGINFFAFSFLIIALVIISFMMMH